MKAASVGPSTVLTERERTRVALLSRQQARVNAGVVSGRQSPEALFDAGGAQLLQRGPNYDVPSAMESRLYALGKATPSGDVTRHLKGVAMSELLGAIPPATTWRDLPPVLKHELEARAKEDRDNYRREWGYEALEEKAGRFGGGPPSEGPVYRAFVQHVKTTFEGLPWQEDEALKQVRHPQLLKVLWRLHLLHRGAAGILLVTNHHHDDVEWTGTGTIKEFPVSSRELVEGQRRFSHNLLAELDTLDTTRLNELERALQHKALYLIRSLETGSLGRAGVGGEDLLHMERRIPWLDDLMTAFRGGNMEPEAFLRAVNAFWLMPLEGVHMGIVKAAEFAYLAGIHEQSITKNIGRPDTDSVAKAFILLGEMAMERFRNDERAQEPFKIYTKAEREQLAVNFWADLELPGEVPSLEVLKEQTLEYRERFEESRSTVIRDLIEVLSAGDDVLSPEDRALLVSDVKAETDLSKLYQILIKGFKQHPVAQERLQTAWESSSSLQPGKNSETILQRRWEKFLEFTAHHLDQTTAAKLPPLVSFSSGPISSTAADGSVNLGMGKSQPLVNWDYTLLHEGDHSLKRVTGLTTTGINCEAAADVAALTLIRPFLEFLYKDDPVKVLVELLRVAEFDRARIAGTLATLEVCLREPTDEPGLNSLEYARKVVRANGVTGSDEDSLVVRAQMPQYLGYLLPRVFYRNFLERLETQVGRKLDPYLLNKAGVVYPQLDAKAVERVRTALAPKE